MKETTVSNDAIKEELKIITEYLRYSIIIFIALVSGTVTQIKDDRIFSESLLLGHSGQTHHKLINFSRYKSI